MNRKLLLAFLSVIVCAGAAYWYLSGGLNAGWDMEVEQLSKGKERITITSPKLAVQGIYRSMQGPFENFYFKLPLEAPQAFITGYGAAVNPVEGQPADLPSDLMCHNNFDMDLQTHYSQWGLEDRISMHAPRLFTITQGQNEVQFPEGFGIPVSRDDNLSVNAQVLNLVHEQLSVEASQQVNIELSYELELKPLFQQSVMLLPEVAADQQAEFSGSGGASCARIPALSKAKLEYEGKQVTGHWIVHPGRDTLRAGVTNMLLLPFSTTLHYAGVHVHPTCESLELWDATANQSVFRCEIENRTDHLGLKHIPAYSSATGTWMVSDHEYELICTTNNTTDTDQDMMAVMLLYLYDQQLDSLLAR